jgi:hypothetical protein
MTSGDSSDTHENEDDGPKRDLFTVDETQVDALAALEFLWRHGVSVLDSPLWHLFALFSSADWTIDVRSTDPFEAHFSITLDRDQFELAMDDALTVEPLDRTDIGGRPEHHDVAWSP